MATFTRRFVNRDKLFNDYDDPTYYTFKGHIPWSRIYELRLFNNSVFGCLEALTYLDPRLRRNCSLVRSSVLKSLCG
jgi:hypothetical protein